MNLNEARSILGNCGYSFLKESTELSRDIVLKFAKQLAHQDKRIGLVKGKNPEDGDFDIIIYYNDNKVKVASYKGYENAVYVREFKSSLSGMKVKKVETLEDLRSFIDSTLKYMEKYKENNNNQYKTSVNDIENDKEEWANNIEQNESLKIKKALKLLSECGYSIKGNANLNEMSRASDRVLGHDSVENLLYMLADWKKQYDRTGKNATLGQFAKFIQENGISWDLIDGLELPGLPRTEPTTRSSKRIDLEAIIASLQEELGQDVSDVRNRVDLGKDDYDRLIDTFWDYYEKNRDGEDVSGIVDSENFQALVRLFADDPDTAREVFGRNFDKANSKLQRFIDPDSPAALIGEFWDWYYAKKAGHDVDFDTEKAEKIADLLETPNAKDEIFGGSGSYFTVLRTISNILGRQLGQRDADFDYDSLGGELSL